MVFTNQDFIDLMEFCRNVDNFHESAQNPFDTISNISKSYDNNPLIENSEFLCFNLDNICANAHITDNGRKKNHPSSVDGLYYNVNKSKMDIYFIEFKGLPINSIDYKSKLSSIIDLLKSGHCDNPQNNCPLSNEIFKSLNNVKNRFEDEIICQLKIKTTESLFLTLPLIYKYYCEKTGLDFKENLNEFISWLLKSKKYFIIVFDDKAELSPSNRHFTFDNRLKNKFKHFTNIANITTCIVEKSLFEREYLCKYFAETPA